MKKFTMLATAVALSAVAAPSFAYTVTSSLTGNFAITGLNDGINIPVPGGVINTGNNTFTVSTSGVNGNLSIVVPPSGAYTVYTGGTATVDVGGAIPPVTISAAPAVELFSGLLGFTSATPGTYNAMFTSAIPRATVTTNTFDLAYDGATSASVLASLNSLFGTSFVVPTGAGLLAISYSLFTDGFDVAITETASGWPGFGSILGAVDAQNFPNGQIDGTFALTNVTANVVPEPTSLALLGLGLAGLGAMRRRKQA